MNGLLGFPKRVLIWLYHWIVEWPVIRLSTIRLNPYEDYLNPREIILPIYLVFQPVVALLSYRNGTGTNWSYGGNAACFVFALVLMYFTPRYRYIGKRKLRASFKVLELTPVGTITGDVFRAYMAIPEKDRVDKFRVCLHRRLRQEEGVKYVESNIKLVKHTNRQTGRVEDIAEVRFTLWMSTADAVLFKLRRGDEVETV